MNSPLLIPEIGFRFTFHGSEFEITNVSNGNIRFSAVRGGKIMMMTLDQFIQYYQNKNITFTYVPNKILLDPKVTGDVRRKQLYVMRAITLVHPFSSSAVSKIIHDVKQEIDDQNPPSSRTVMRWISKYLENTSDWLRIRNIKKGNETLRFSPTVEQLILKAVKEIYLYSELKTNCKDVEAYVVGLMLELGILDTPPSSRTIQRRLKDIDPYLIIKAKRGSRYANKLLKSAGVKVPTYFILQIVEFDTHYLDIIITAEDGTVLGRPFLCCGIDVFSRAIIGFHISMMPACSATTLATLKKILSNPNKNMPGGVPTLIIPDNGVEFKNNSLASLCEHFKITIQPAQNRTGDDKAHIERFFRTITEGIIQKISGTTFSSPEKRGDYDSVRKASITIEQLNEYVSYWITSVYHQSIHSTTDRAPICAWNDAALLAPPMCVGQDEVDILCRRPHMKSLNGGQIQYMYLFYYAHSLATIEITASTKVKVFVDELDLSHVYVEHPISKEMIKADSTEPEYTKGLTLYAHREARKIRDTIKQQDINRLGKYANLYALFELHKKIQSDIQDNKKKRLKQIKLDIPKKLKQLIDDGNTPPMDCLINSVPSPETHGKKQSHQNNEFIHPSNEDPEIDVILNVMEF